jgi:hypothetical protein
MCPPYRLVATALKWVMDDDVEAKTIHEGAL